ncbi:hypothetical protein MP228_009092 [Amoeboaphelidium protococcarum]|nr:hypothetical protein MP228_009092 [Amoeboaphelidium protococcarum]
MQNMTIDYSGIDIVDEDELSLDISSQKKLLKKSLAPSAEQDSNGIPSDQLDPLSSSISQPNSDVLATSGRLPHAQNAQRGDAVSSGDEGSSDSETVSKRRISTATRPREQVKQAKKVPTDAVATNLQFEDFFSAPAQLNPKARKKEKAKKKQSTLDDFIVDDSSGSEEEYVNGQRKNASGRRGRRRKSQAVKSGGNKDFKISKKRNIDMIMISDSELDSDQSGEDASEGKSKKKNKKKNSNSKQKAEQKEEPRETRELTPPPAFTETLAHECLNEFANNLVPSMEMDVFERNLPKVYQETDKKLDPELEAIRLQFKREREMQNASSEFGGPQKNEAYDVVQLVVKGVEDKRNRLCAFEMAVKLKSTHRLEKVIHVVSQNWENIDPADIVLTYRDVRLFPTSTLKSLNIEEDESLLAMDKNYYSIFAQERLQKNSYQHEDDQDSDDSSSDDDNQSEFVTIKIQNNQGDVVKIKTRKVIQICAIVDHYKKVKEINEDVQVRLKFDAEFVDEDDTLASLDVEDNDQFDVIIQQAK